MTAAALHDATAVVVDLRTLPADRLRQLEDTLGTLPEDAVRIRYPEALRRARPMPMRVAEIARVVCDLTGHSLPEMLGNGRAQPLAAARSLVVMLARHRTGRSYPEIGRALGGRDHSTAMHAARRAQQRMNSCPDFRALAAAASARLDAIEGLHA